MEHGQLIRERDLIKTYKIINNELSPTAIRGMFVPRSAVSPDYPLNRSRRIRAPKVQTIVHPEKLSLPSLCLVERAASGHHRAAHINRVPHSLWALNA